MIEGITERQAEILDIFLRTGSVEKTRIALKGAVGLRGVQSLLTNAGWPGERRQAYAAAFVSNGFRMLDDAIAFKAEDFKPDESLIPPPSPVERRDAEFWRKKARAAEDRAAEAEHIAEVLGGLAGIPADRPRWEMEYSESKSRSIGILHTSDVHLGEKVEAEDINQFNSYDPDVCAVRMKRLFTTACTIIPRWMEDTRCDGLLLTLDGDLVSGDIHHELQITNSLTSLDQVEAVVDIYDAGIAMALDTFDTIHVAAVAGNHGRQTMKEPHKIAGRLSYDILAAKWLRDRYRNDPRVTWTIATGADARIPVFGKTILVNHGHKLGGGGGMGFIGPAAPIVRGGKQKMEQQRSAMLDCDLLLTAHYHTSMNPTGILANGSVIGYNEYIYSKSVPFDVPRQWIARFSEKWGLTERLDVALEERPDFTQTSTAPWAQ